MQRHKMYDLFHFVIFESSSMVHVVLLVQEKHSCPPVEHSVVSVVLDATIFLASLALFTMVGPTLCLVLVLSFICTPRVNTFFHL